jgi:hypothetical protein
MEYGGCGVVIAGDCGCLARFRYVNGVAKRQKYADNWSRGLVLWVLTREKNLKGSICFFTNKRVLENVL